MPARNVVRPPPSRPLNKLLAGLSDADYERLRPNLRTVSTERKQVFHSRGERIRDVVFLNVGVASVTMMMQDGTMVEVATVGTEGMVGMDAFLGADVSTAEAMLQVPDASAELMPLPAFRTELAARGPLFDAVERYSRGYLTLLMHSTACMALHTVQERCCRWLLMTHDRIGRDEFLLSQEFLAMMLGTTRPTVSVVASSLQQAGLIAYRHGHMKIVDREGVEAGSCECYGAVRSRFDELGL